MKNMRKASHFVSWNCAFLLILDTRQLEKHIFNPYNGLESANRWRRCDQRWDIYHFECVGARWPRICPYGAFYTLEFCGFLLLFGYLSVEKTCFYSKNVRYRCADRNGATCLPIRAGLGTKKGVLSKNMANLAGKYCPLRNTMYATYTGFSRQPSKVV